MAALTYADVYGEVADIRFQKADTAELARVKKWVNAAELKIWNSGEWVFKRAAAANLAVTVNVATPTMPADYGKTRTLIDENGNPLAYLDPQDFEDQYTVGVSPGHPDSFTVINRQVYLGPTPSASYTFKHGYRRRYAHLNNVAAVTAGVMSADDDTPLWDAEHHYVLVPQAILIGAELNQDRAPGLYKDLRDELLASMRDELEGGVESQTIQYG